MFVRSPRSVALLGAVAATLVAGLTCKDLVGVSPDTAIRFVIGTNVSGEVEDAQEPRYYEIAVKADSSYAVLVEALEGAVLVRVRNPTAGFIGGVTVSAPSGPIERHSTGIFTPLTDAHWLVVVQPASVGPARFRMRYEPVRRDPEDISAQIALGDTVTGETLYSVSDIDEFTFTGQAGQVMNAFLQALGPPQAGPAGLRILSTVGTQLKGVNDTAGDTELELSASGRFVLPQTGAYRVAVGPSNFLGPYRFQLYPIDLAPESHTAAIALGDTVEGEAIGHVGDLDEFVFNVPDSQPVYVFLQGNTGRTGDVFGVTLPGLVDSVYGFLFSSNGTDSSLLNGFLGPLNLPGTGPFTVRVGGNWRGPYRAVVHVTDPAPETAPSTFALNDSLLGEGVDYFADVDRFTVNIPADTFANLILMPQPAAPGGALLASLSRTLGGSGTGVSGPDTGGPRGSGRARLTAGDYLVSVAAASHEYRGDYGFWLPVFGGLPESIGDTVVVGDTVVGESIAVPGDLDLYWVYGRAGGHWNVRFQGEAGAPTGSLALAFSTNPAAIVTLISPTASPTLDHVQSQRVDLQRTGWHRVQVTSTEDGRRLSDVGSYRFVIDTLGDRPESSSVMVSVADTVTESVNYPGDFDRFEFAGPPGQEVAIEYQGVPLLEVTDTATADTVRTPFGVAGQRLLAGIVVPSSGRAGISVYQPRAAYSCVDSTCTGAYTWQGTYHFIVHAVNRSPETAPDTVAVGDTLQGEAIDGVADIDEFTVSAAPGTILTAHLRLLQDVVPADRLVWLEFADAVTGTTISGRMGTWLASPPDSWMAMSFQVPATGLIVRLYADDFATSSYEVRLTSP